MLKFNFKRLKSLKLSKANSYLILTLVIYNALIIGLGIYLNTWRYNAQFIKFNILQLAIILIMSTMIFVLSYKYMMKKRASVALLIAFVASLMLLIYITSGLNIILEELLNKPSYSASNILFVYISLIIFSLLLSHYDFPIIDSAKKFYIAVRDNFYKHIGLFMILMLVVSYAGFMNESFIYIISSFILIDNFYLLKALLSNLRK